MHRRRYLSSLALAAVVAVQALLVARATAGAQEQQSAGVDGYSYTSPSFGYGLTWPAAWEVRDEASGDGADALYLATGGGALAIVGTRQFGADANACLAAFAAEFAAAEGIADLAQVEDGPTRPIAGGVGVVFSTYAGTTSVPASQGDGTGVAEGEVRTPATVYVECRPLASGDSVLAIAIAAPDNVYDAVADEARPLLRRLDLAGQAADMVEAEPVDDPQLMIRRDGESFTKFSERLLADVNAFWADEFEDDDRFYIEPDLRVFDGPVETVCGGQVAPYEVGPFYCSLSQAVFLDAPWGEDELVAYGVGSLVYTVAHEIGHHVQNQLGYLMLQLSVEVELQADCLAGAYFKDAVADGQLDPVAFDAILPLAATIGDQERSSFGHGAHGMGSQRVVMLQRGFADGRDGCGL